jgi:hypothetical protein
LLSVCIIIVGVFPPNFVGGHGVSAPPKVRVGLTPNTGAKKPTAKFTKMVAPTFQDLHRFAKSTLKLKGKTIRIFICKVGGDVVMTYSL